MHTRPLTYDETRTVKDPAARPADRLRILGWTAHHLHQRTEALAGRKWWQAIEDWTEWKSAHMEYRSVSRKLPADQWDALALHVIDEALFHHDTIGIQDHPFRSRTVDHLDEAIDVALGDRPGEELAITWAVRHSPELAARFTRAEVARLVRAEVARRQAVAASTLMLTAHVTTQRRRDEPDNRWLVVQHHASGLRARFCYDGPMRGTVFAKPYKIPTLDPHTPDPEPYDDWRQYTGLGIGARIYEHAATLLPALRWRAGAQTLAAEALRRHLHAKDPWHWQAHDCTCRDAWTGFSHPSEALTAVHEPTRPEIPADDDQPSPLAGSEDEDGEEAHDA